MIKIINIIKTKGYRIAVTSLSQQLKCEAMKTCVNKKQNVSPRCNIAIITSRHSDHIGLSM